MRANKLWNQYDFKIYIFTSLKIKWTNNDTIGNKVKQNCWYNKYTSYELKLVMLKPNFNILL